MMVVEGKAHRPLAKVVWLILPVCTLAAGLWNFLRKET